MSKSLILRFSKDNTISLPIATTEFENGIIVESVSKILPLGNTVLIAEYGLIGLLTVLSAQTSNQHVQVKANLAIVGMSSEVKKKFSYLSLGDNIMPRSNDDFAMKSVYDTSNDYSYTKLAARAKENGELAIAVHVANDKAKSKVGLNLQSMYADPVMLNRAKELRGKKSSRIIYKDEKVPFVNYILTDASNIIAIIQ